MITDKSAGEQEIWLVEKGLELKQEENNEDNAILRQSKVLYEVWSIWSADHNPEKKSLSNEAKWRWGYDFYAWAKAYTKRRAGKEQAESTIDQKISNYRYYLGEEIIEAPEVVYIPKRDEFGKLVDPDLADENAWERIEPDFSKCDYGKMVVARGTANKGQMSPEAWSALFDPYASVATLKEALRIDKENKPKEEDKDNFYLQEEEGIIFACDGQNRVPVFQALFENDEGELFTRGLCHVLKAIGLHVPLSYQK